MAVLYITECESMGLDADGKEIQALTMPPIAEQAVTFGTTTASAAFNARTRVVMLLSTAAANISFGAAPTATASTTAIPGEVPLFFTVPAGASLKVAAVTR